MKKVFTYVTVLAAIAMLTMVTMTSCKDKKDPYDVANGILSRDWQGYIQDQKENGSSWKDMDRSKVTIHFQKTTDSPFRGIGYQLEWEDDGSVKDKNKFNWYITSDRIDIDYNQFKGEMYDDKQHRYVFDLTPTPAVDWNRYFN